MIHYNYKGKVVLRKTESINQQLVHPVNSSEEFLNDNLWISNSNLIKFRSKQYVLLIDGVIYNIGHKIFREENYLDLIDRFSKEKLGTLHTLNGEYVLIIADLLSNEIWFITSESGSAAFFFRESIDNFHFSNSINGLLKIPNESNEIHLQRVYDVLVGNNLGSEHTCFTEIKRLLPGQYLKVKDGTCMVADYSMLYNRERDTLNLRDPFGRFREVFAHAVSNRLHSDRIGIAISSGKDSTSVAAMAYNVDSSANHKLFGFCYKPSFLSEELLSNHRYNETILLESFYRDYPEIQSRDVEVESGTVISSLENSIKIYGEPVYGASNQFWIQKMQQMIAVDQMWDHAEWSTGKLDHLMAPSADG